MDGVLFLKLLFVADKDSIALTLGKRLAHKTIAQTDLKTWLDANSIEHDREGLAEIEDHIDPVRLSLLILAFAFCCVVGTVNDSPRLCF
jgi:hypothetical protein